MSVTADACDELLLGDMAGSRVVRSILIDDRFEVLECGNGKASLAAPW